jgi:hypothetical protein
MTGWLASLCSVAVEHLGNFGLLSVERDILRAPVGNAYLPLAAATDQLLQNSLSGFGPHGTTAVRFFVSPGGYHLPPPFYQAVWLWKLQRCAAARVYFGIAVHNLVLTWSG